MKLLLLIFMTLSLLATSPLVIGQEKSNTDYQLEGFAVTKGGEGGRVIKVTNLNAKGPGSLRAALAEEGKRIIVFEVGGVINLNREGNIRITNPYVTLAGQTAPSPGITIIRGGIAVKAHDVIIQHIRVRPGDAGAEKNSGWEPDGIATNGKNAYNIIVDHSSFSWAVDENLSASGPMAEGPEATSRRITFSNNLIAEALSESTHASGEHSKGSLIHDFCQDIAIIGNLYASNVDRSPYFKAHTTGVIANNLIYNPVKNAIQLGYWAKKWEGSDYSPINARVSVVGNVLLYGQDTEKKLPLVNDKGDAYMEDNIALDTHGNPAPMRSENINLLTEKPVWPINLKPMSATEVEKYVLKNVGARPKDRDAIDKRIIKDVMERKGKIIHSQNEVGGYPEVKMTRRTLNIPAQGVQAWLKKMTEEIE